MVTKKELLRALVAYIKTEVVPHIEDKPTRMVMSAALYAVNAKPAIIDPFLNNPLVASVLQGESGLYDTETIFKVLNDLVEEYGGIPVTIPPIKFITSTENTLTFRSGDIEKLEEYVNKVKENRENA